MSLPPYDEVELAAGRFQAGTDEQGRLYVAVQGNVLLMTDFIAAHASTQQLREIARICLELARRIDRQLS